jgi:DNA adenine methylase
MIDKQATCICGADLAPRPGGGLVRPLVKYPGSKWQLAPWITSFFSEHLHYVEPYCGSAAVFFAKAPSVHEVLNDLNGSLTNLFTVIRDRGEDLAKAVEMTPWSEAEYERYEKDYMHPDPVEHARRFLIRCWQAHGGNINQRTSWSHSGLNGRYPVRLWQQLPTRILAVVDRLREAEIRQKPALEIIRYYNSPDTLLYIDPPYVHSTRGRDYYLYEMDNQAHLALLDALEQHRGPVVLSGYAHPLYDERLKDWQRVSMPTIAEKGKARTEVLWLNRKVSRHQQLELLEAIEKR